MHRGVFTGAHVLHDDDFARLGRAFGYRNESAGAHFFQLFFVQYADIQRLIRCQFARLTGQPGWRADVRWHIAKLAGKVNPVGHGIPFVERIGHVIAQPDQALRGGIRFRFIFFTFGFSKLVGCAAKGHRRLFCPPGLGQFIIDQS